MVPLSNGVEGRESALESLQHQVRVIEEDNLTHFRLDGFEPESLGQREEVVGERLVDAVEDPARLSSRDRGQSSGAVSRATDTASFLVNGASLRSVGSQGSACAMSFSSMDSTWAPKPWSTMMALISN